MRTLQAAALLRRGGRRLRLGREQSRKGSSGRSRPTGPSCRRSSSRRPIKSLTYADGALWAALGEEGTVVRIDPTTDETRALRPRPLGDERRRARRARRRRRAARASRTSPATSRATSSGSDGKGRSCSTAERRSSQRSRSRPGMRRRRCSTTRPARGSSTTRTRRARPGGSSCPRSPRTSRGLGRRAHVHVQDPGGLRLLAAVERGGDGRVVPARRSNARVELTKLSGDELSPSTGEHRRRGGVLRGQEPRTSRASRPSGDELVFRLPQAAAGPAVARRARELRRSGPTLRSSRAVSRSPSRRPGPYYLAALTDSLAVLKRNPNYGGSRPQHLDAIVVEFNVAPSEAATRIENGTLDYFLESQNPTLRPNTAAARAAGDRYRLRRTTGSSSSPSTTDRPLFADVRMRRAVQYALDRQALADADPAGGLPATRLLYPSIVGYDDTPLYPLQRRRPHGTQARRRAHSEGRRLHLGRSAVHRRASTGACATSSRPSASR